MKLESLSQLLEDQLKDLFSAENQLVKALPKMADKANDPKLRQAITDHLRETEGHVGRLEQIGEKLGIKLSGKTCKAMEGLIKEGKEVLGEKGDPAVLDAALIGAAQRVEHYEMAAYGTARAIAEKMEQADVIDLLQATLDEEKAADEKLSDISENDVLVAAEIGGAEEDSAE